MRTAAPPGGSHTTAGPHPGWAAHEWYTSPLLLDIERRNLFDRSWALVGTTDELADPGSYLTVAAGSIPLVVVRTSDGRLRAHQNMCRHRGLPLAEGNGSCGRYLTCPYHQWSYDLDGALRQIPQAEAQFPGVDTRRWGLLPASVGEWQGMVFANPDPAAPTLERSLGSLARRLAPCLDGPLTEVANVKYTAKCNWKLLVENHVDVYHLWYLHSRSLSMYDHSRFEWDIETDNWCSFEPSKARPGDRLGAHLLFPNLMIVTTTEYFATYDATPLSPDLTGLTLRIRSVEGAESAALIESVRSFMAEDVDVCERLQTVAGSSSFAFGPLAASHEAPVRAFHAAVAERCHG